MRHQLDNGTHSTSSLDVTENFAGITKTREGTSAFAAPASSFTDETRPGNWSYG
ncbi:hypothetical protein J3A64_004496 [Pseudarthrobacter sp. PvP004]|nr:hypothetical protein [Pseudarthrobacter sp. PvP004]